MYTYIHASLPALHLGEAPPISSADFLEHYRDLVRPAERADFVSVLKPDEPLHATTGAAHTWLAVEAQIRNAVAKWRATKYRVDANHHLRPQPAYRADIAQEVSAALAKTPLERELALDTLRWRLLEEMEREKAWSFAALYAYAVRLRIAERWAPLSDEAGWVALENFLGSLESEGAHGEP